MGTLRGRGRWQMDHEFPIAEADLTTARAQKRCLGDDNLVPM
jgi:hypothetical protein